MSLTRWALRLLCPKCEMHLVNDRLGRAEKLHAVTLLDQRAERRKMEDRSGDIRTTVNALITLREETERARQEKSDNAP